MLPELQQFKLEKADIHCFLKEQLLQRWRLLFPRVLQAFLHNRLPRALRGVGTKQPEFLCSSVPVLPIVGVLQPHTHSLLCAAKVQDEALVRSCFLILCQPEVGLATPHPSIVGQGEDGTRWETPVVAGAPHNPRILTPVADWGMFHTKSDKNSKLVLAGEWRL